MKTICQEALELLTPIKDELVIAHMLSTGDKGCPEGWLIGLKSGLDKPAVNGVGAKFQHELNTVLKNKMGMYLSTAANECSAKYPQNTPKKRSIALLQDAIDLGL